MKSRLQLLVVLLFIGIAGVIFVFSGGGNEDSTGLEIVEDISDNKSGSIVDIKSSSAETDKDSPKEAKSDNLKKEGLQGNEK